MPVIAIDFGGTNIKIGIVENGRILFSIAAPATATESMEDNLSNTFSFIEKVLSQKNISKKDIEGIGIALPVIVNSKNNSVITEYVKYRDAIHFDFNAWFKKNWNVPIQLENDARAALVGEWQYGVGKGCEDLAMLTLGTGIGSAVITNNKVLRGRHFMAGNMSGHTTINLDGADCNCGSCGCLEAEASTWALPQIAKRFNTEYKSLLINKPDLNFGDLVEAIENGDDFAMALFEHCTNMWGICAANLVHSFDPEKIIVSGGIMKSASRILPVLQKCVDTRTWLPSGAVAVVAATQPEFAALLGLEYLLKNKN